MPVKLDNKDILFVIFVVVATLFLCGMMIKLVIDIIRTLL